MTRSALQHQWLGMLGIDMSSINLLLRNVACIDPRYNSVSVASKWRRKGRQMLSSK